MNSYALTASGGCSPLTIIRPGPCFYTLENPSDWLAWGQGYSLDIATESFNTDNIANAARIVRLGVSMTAISIPSTRAAPNARNFLHRGWNRFGGWRARKI